MKDDVATIQRKIIALVAYSPTSCEELDKACLEADVLLGRYEDLLKQGGKGADYRNVCKTIFRS